MRHIRVKALSPDRCAPSEKRCMRAVDQKLSVPYPCQIQQGVTGNGGGRRMGNPDPPTWTVRSSEQHSPHLAPKAVVRVKRVPAALCPWMSAEIITASA